MKLFLIAYGNVAVLVPALWSLYRPCGLARAFGYDATLGHRPLAL